jgi:excisionase family DNA binding protein
MEEQKVVENLLTVKDVCGILRISRYTVYRWMEGGKLERITLSGGIIRVTAESVSKVIESGKEK